jgi:hypothetical protein
MMANLQEQAKPKLILWLLMSFPVGLIVFSIASFGIWRYLENKKLDDEQKIKMAFYRPISEEGYLKQLKLLTSASEEGVAVERVIKTLGSALGEDNMGYRLKELGHFSQGTYQLMADLVAFKKQRQIKLLWVTYSRKRLESKDLRRFAKILVLMNDLIKEQPEVTLRLWITPDDKEQPWMVNAEHPLPIKKGEALHSVVGYHAIKSEVGIEKLGVAESIPYQVFDEVEKTQGSIEVISDLFKLKNELIK